MNKVSIAATILVAFLFAGACSKKQPETAQNQPAAAAPTASTPAQPAAPEAAASPSGETTPDAAMPNELPALVTLTDGSKYKGVLVSKTGSQLTFRGDNGATRTFDSRDVKSIRFGDDSETPASAKRAPAPPAPSEPTPAPAQAPAQSAANSAPAAEPAPPPPPREIVIPSGTQVSVRTNENIDSKTASAGQTFSAVISQSVVDDSGAVAIPRGSPATLVIKQASAGKIKSNELVLDMRSVNVRGRNYRVETSDVLQKGKSGLGANKRTALFAGGGTALGAVIGAIAGGGKGAAIGAASGAAAGAGGQVLTRGSVKVPAETILTFRLEAPLQLEAQ